MDRLLLLDALEELARGRGASNLCDVLPVHFEGVCVQSEGQKILPSAPVTGLSIANCHSVW